MRKPAAMIVAIALSLGLVVGTGTTRADAATKPHAPARVDTAWPMPNEKFTVDGNIGTNISRLVTLRRWKDGSWQKVATVRTNKHGKYRFTLRAPEKQIKLRVTAKKVRTRNHFYPTVRSRYKVFKTMPQGAVIGDIFEPIVVNEPYEVYIRTNANRRTRNVQLQVKQDATTWVTVADGYTDNFGRVWLPYTPTAIGTITVRAHLVAWQGVAAYDGPEATLTVVAP
ncbi:MAG TPA: hypothetical protein PKD84_09065 [Propionicimonas sp.]|nr:hypothetical protein [Propionicimonas sp.]